MKPEVVSIEPSRRCSKACAFCYNGSSAEGAGDWAPDDVVRFVSDLAKNGVRVVSFGGGEPLEWPGIHETLHRLHGTLLRTLTTNGLPLDAPGGLEDLARSAPDKVHISVHQPSNRAEVKRVVRQVKTLDGLGIRSGVNLLVSRSRLGAARRAAHMLRLSGVGNDRIVYLPRRGGDTPTPDEVRTVAGRRFQSMTCLSGCGRSPRFASIAADRTVAWCSYTTTRKSLPSLDHAGLMAALYGLGLQSCDGGRLVRTRSLPVVA